ncbi:MAG: multicopper oxidase family protein, partial [Acidimicrobiia bacterium]|nr:multicopper oxidase family protein [Acidimicrobiia bacterium]
RDENGIRRTDHLVDVDLCPHGAENLPKTVTHLHGGHVPAAVDGYPEHTFLPGQSETYVYPNNQQASTLWYHDHSLGITRLNVYAGMAAFYLVRDANELALDLPTGEFEIPMAFQDRSFNPDGSLLYPSAWQQHFFGDFQLVNGKVWPYVEVKRAKYRFRWLAGANARTYSISFDNGMSFELIGVEGGFIESPITLTEITLGPAERADVIVDFSQFAPGTEIILQNSAPAPYPAGSGDPVPNLMKFIVTADTGPTPPTPTSLTTIEQLDINDAVAFREFELTRDNNDPCTGSVWLINGLGWNDITEIVDLGTTEVWDFINPSGIMHPMHMHLVFFQVVERQPFDVIDGEIVPVGDPLPPGPEEQGWKDTVKVGPNEIVRVIARFEDYTGLYAYHCHILEHEDHEMMRQFKVVCRADLTGSSDPNDPSYGMPDGDADGDDFFFYLDAFATADFAICDLTGSSDPNDPTFDIPDGDCDGDDFFRYLDLFAAGCP